VPYNATITWSDGKNTTISGTYYGYEYSDGDYWVVTDSSTIDGCSTTTTTTTTVLLSFDEPVTKTAIAPPKTATKTYNYTPIIVMIAVLIAAIVGYVVYTKKYRKSLFRANGEY
jgi:hypothetical protein